MGLDLNPLDGFGIPGMAADAIADEIINAKIGGDENALHSAAQAWADLSTELINISNALVPPINALQGRNWTGESRDKFIGSYANPLQSELKDGAAHATTISSKLTDTANAISEAKKGIRSVIHGIIDTILITAGAEIVAAVLSGGLSLAASAAADGAEVAAIVARIMVFVNKFATVLRILSNAFKIFAKWNLIGAGFNLGTKIIYKGLEGPRGFGDNLIYSWSSKDGQSLVVGSALVGGGAVLLAPLGAASSLKLFAGTRFGSSVLYWGAAGRFGGAGLPVLGPELSPFLTRVAGLSLPIRMGIGGALAGGVSTGFAKSNNPTWSWGKSLVFGGENLATGGLGMANPLGPGAGVVSNNAINLGLELGSAALPGSVPLGKYIGNGAWAKARGDQPSNNLLPSKYGSLSGRFPMVQPPGTVPTYTVKPGDNLWNIAAQQYPNHDPHQYPNIYWGTNANTHTNIVNPNLIYPGEQIQILPERTSGGQVQPPLPVPSVNGYQPVSGASLPPAPPPVTHHLAPGGSGSAPHPQAGGSGIVTVRPGDTLSAIAQRNHMSLQQLEAANRGLGNPNHIYPGEEVVIPGQAAA